MNTHDAFVRFGKHQGIRLTRVPVSYLTWAVTNTVTGPVELAGGQMVPMHEAAKSEIERRGERMQKIEVSLHAIDRASLYFVPKFRLEHGHMEGIVSWLSRLAWEAWQQREAIGRKKEDGTWKIEFAGIVFVVEELAVPVVKTVEPV